MASQVALVVKNPVNAGDIRDEGSIPGLARFPWRRKWQPTLVFLPGKSHVQRCLVSYSPWGHKELDTIKHVCAPAYENGENSAVNLHGPSFSPPLTFPPSNTSDLSMPPTWQLVTYFLMIS